MTFRPEWDGLEMFAARPFPAVPPFDGTRLERRVRKSPWPKLAIVLAIATLAAAHWYVPRSNKNIHNLIYHLDFLPLVSAGMLYGWRGAGVAALLAATVQGPVTWMLWRHDVVYAVDQVGETAVFSAAGLIVGAFAARERRHREKIEQTTAELERVYTELRENLDKLRKAERMAAVAQLSASLAHEIRNPLASISGAAGILKRGHGTKENVDDCLEIIDLESQRLNKLLANFLTFARPRAPRFQPTDVEAVIDSVIALAAHNPAAAGIRFEKRVEAGLPEIQCDPEQMKQVLLNLAINAMEATVKGRVTLTASARNGTATLTVVDEGAGFAPDQRDRIFDPFFTTKEHGTGLGLAIAAKIVEQHGGVLRAESAPVRGVAMVVELPVERKPA